MAEGLVARKLAAILAADVVEYSRLMGEDEEATLRLLKAYREVIDGLIANHQGRVFGSAGDSVMAEFASPVEAVRCAVEIQQDLEERNADLPEDRRMRFRIGVNLGDVMVESNNLFGDGVNVAARLEGLAEPGGICISDSAFQQVRDRLKVGFESLGDQQVKNIVRPVGAYRVLTDPDSSGKVLSPPAKKAMRWKLPAIAAVLVIIVVGGGLFARWQAWSPSLAPSTAENKTLLQLGKPSIAILPFSNRSGDPKQDYFSDGITEDVITLLGGYESLAVMAFNAVLPYKGKAVHPAEAGRGLGVRYLVEGSVRRAGQRVRVTARLTDADNGILLWSQQFDDELKDVFAVQDTIARRIAGTLIASLTRLEQQRALVKPTENLDAYDLVLRGRAQIALASRSGNREARRLLRQATEIDPNYAAAYAWLGRAYYLMATDGWTEFPGDKLKRAEGYALKSLKLNPDNIEAHRILGRVHAIQFQYERAFTEIDRALSLNPSDAEAYGDRGLMLLWVGRLEEAVASLETAFAFNPNLRGDYAFAHGLALYSLRRHQESIRVLERGAVRYPNYVFIRAALAASYGQIGRAMEAKRNADTVRRLLPIFNPAMFGSRFRDRKLFDYLAEGLHKAGLT